VPGQSQSWYQDPAYLTAVVKESRKVSPRRVWTWPRNVRTTVHDSSSEVRWLGRRAAALQR
jgi:nitrile hydratase